MAKCTVQHMIANGYADNFERDTKYYVHQNFDSKTGEVSKSTIVADAGEHSSRGKTGETVDITLEKNSLGNIDVLFMPAINDVGQAMSFLTFDPNGNEVDNSLDPRASTRSADLTRAAAASVRACLTK